MAYGTGWPRRGYCAGIAAKKFSRYLAARKAVPKCVSADWISQDYKGTRSGRNRCQPYPAIKLSGLDRVRLRKKAPGPATSGRHPLPDTGVDRVPITHRSDRILSPRSPLRCSTVASTILRNHVALGGTAPPFNVRTVEPLRTSQRRYAFRVVEQVTYRHRSTSPSRSGLISAPLRRRPTRLHSDRRREPRLYARNSGQRRTSGRLPIAAHCPRSSTRDIVTSDVTQWSFAWPWPKDERECRNLVLLPKPREGYERTAPGPALPFGERGSWVLLRSFKNPKIQVRGFREAAWR